MDKEHTSEYKQYALNVSGAFLQLIHGKIYKEEVDKVRPTDRKWLDENVNTTVMIERL